MEVDVLIVMENGIATETHVVEAEATAEATFEDLVKKLLNWTDEDFDNEFEGCYASMQEWVNREYLEPTGKEIIWSYRIKVNKFK